ncbi:MAG: Spore coat protein [Hyphomicrobiales bacterium]|jgi:spore coat protein U-like protein|nr:Spore coat protein [Hyphomicrobiales bacterium]
MLRQSFMILSALCMLSSTALAGTTVGTQFTVQVELTAGCNIITDIAGPIVFTSTPGTATVPADVSASASVTCTNTTPFDLHMTTTNAFKMVNGANQIPYLVLATPGAAQRTLGSTLITTGFTGTGTGLPQTIPFVFRIPAASWTPTLPPGIYSDTLTLNVDF